MAIHMRHDSVMPSELFLTDITNNSVLNPAFLHVEGIRPSGLVRGAAPTLPCTIGVLFSAPSGSQPSVASWTLVGENQRLHRVALPVLVELVHPHLGGGALICT